ncbi:SDR family NAD(P)-dependent oxidoreductase [Cohnella lupini]|uniref:NAD(P)-dependent dehydrogenase (Short-subunit alcohol dehydrogenase family) n=1 Tax=Cohnella lupini TaxID=1294267 RepID=A0A3D9HNW3_9BACL|nr:SDR family oxidoreductase [Cohnella lupini]RED51193.1 NAD(P)-dependent dehydrogenase (short-subunit alcohol dehydrogenase family) [Cohnella lupini]
MRNSLDKQLVVVTGAADGIGRAIAERFMSEGADLIVAGRNMETLKKVFEGNSQVVDILQVDATNVNDLEKIAESVKKTGRKLKAVLPIVGNGPQSPIPEVTPEQFHLTMNLNVFSAFFTVQKLIPYMSDKSSIVLISSIAGFQGGKNSIVYNAAKAAVRSMARSFTGELAEMGIRANAISPGPTDTKAFTEFVRGDDELRSNIVSHLPIGHIGKPSEIAAIALFLASDESSYVTGAEIIADGGFTNR